MIGLLFLSGAFLALGIYFLAARALRLPSPGASKAILERGRRRPSHARFLEDCLDRAALHLSGYLTLDEYRKRRMGNILKAAVPILPVLPCLVFLPFLAPVPVFAAVTVYFKESGRPAERMRERREAVERELPRFVATISQDLKNSRDVLAILEGFKKNTGDIFKGELDILTADMRSGSYEAALTRFEARLDSPLLSDVVRGLIGVLRGDDSAAYFQLLSHDFKQMELQRLKKEAQKIPPKIRIFSFLMLLCFLMTYMAIIGYEILNSLGSMF